MKKRNLFVIALLLAAVALASATPKYNWKLASVLPDSHPVHQALVFFADELAKKSNGDIKLTLFPAGQLGQEKDYIEAIKIGSLEFAKVSSGPVGQYAPTFQVISLPLIWRNLAHQHKVLQGVVGKRLMADLDKAGYKGLAFMDAGFRSITATKPIYSPSDLKGLKIRVMQSKPLIDTVNALGGNAVPMGQSEVYSALQTKVIDGWENNEPTVLSFNMQEVAKYYSYTRHSSIPDFLMMNKRLFDGLPKNIQAMVEQTAIEAMEKHNKLWGEMIDKTIADLKAKGMVFNEVRDVTEFQKAVGGVWKEFESIVGKDLIDAVVNTK
ncbi:MAG: TRAP dicarboxylate family transporter subunit DctP [Spirochaetes bacterium]|nr:MAG: TRAP dicarboxylate family transporter subunit DctP [Spirochaetota bacterium]